MSDIDTSNVFGKKVPHVFIIEFQKRGLSHMHLLIFLHGPDKIKTYAQVIKWYVLSSQIQLRILHFIKQSNTIWYMVHVLLGTRVHHVGKVEGALRDILKSL